MADPKIASRTVFSLPVMTGNRLRPSTVLGVATPVNWKKGDDVIIAPSVEPEAREACSKKENVRLLRHRKDGVFDSACVFLDQEKRQCTVYDVRPGVCRRLQLGHLQVFKRFRHPLSSTNDFPGVTVQAVAPFSLSVAAGFRPVTLS